MTPRACCIEPDEDLRARLADLLRESGWEIYACSHLSDDDLPGMPDEQHFDLVVTTGTPAAGTLVELIARIRARSASETTPIVVLGAEEDAGAAERAFVAGVTEAFSWRNLSDFRTYLKSFADEEGADLVGKSALILEDDRIQGFLLQSLLIREGMSTALFDSVESALDGGEGNAFDIVVTDLVLGLGQSGVSFIRRLRQSSGRSANAPIIAVSGFEDDARRIDALRAGAESFLPKPVAPLELIFHVRRLLSRQGERETVARAQTERGAFDPQMLSRLTEREQLICALAVAGHRDKQIAQELGISYWTVRTHLARIFRKFHVSNRVGLAAAIRGAVDAPIERAAAQEEKAAHAEWHALCAGIMDRLPLGVVVTDGTSRIVHVNRAYCEITGYRREELLGRTPRMLRSGLHPPEFHRKLLTSLVKSGRWGGNVWNRSKSGRHYLGKLEIRRLPPGLPMEASFIGVVSDITEEHAHTERLREQSLQDVLTGLANRALLRDRTEYEIARAKRTGRPLALAFIDLDNFKPINDRHGHAVGDGVLQEVAARLAARLRENDTLSRVGGDEFVALLPEVDHREAVRALCSRLVESFRIPFGPCGAYGRIGASVGISIYPDDGKDFETLMEHADQAMYRAKRTGGRSIACYTASATEAPAGAGATDRARLDAALDNDEFELLFQPQVDLVSGRVAAAEALLRWRNPEHGLLAAAHFIPVAERSGSIAKLGGWALHQACAALQRLQRAGHAEVRLSVNVSPLQILRGQPFADDALAAIEGHGIAPGRLELEISESVFLHNAEQAVKALSALAEHGVSLALDGIGRDYFSPAYLRRLPFRAMKIDRRCIGDALRDPYSDSIVRSSLLLAQGLGLEAIAEGVETDEQLAFLRQAGYRHAQGKLLGYPMTLAELVCRLQEAER